VSLLPCLACLACDGHPASTDAPEAASTTVTAAPSSPSQPPEAPEPPRQPDIIIEQATVSVGKEHLATGELGLNDRLVAILKAQPTIGGHAVDFVAMRNAKPSQVASMISALRSGGASGANVKTESRDGATVKLPVSFSTREPDCAAVAWITKDGAIDVWPIGGATAQRVNKGLAGPDMTLGTEAVQHQSGTCSATDLIVGGDDHFPWGVVFDLATSAVQARGSRTTAVVLTTSATPGRKLHLE
jgi:hypothetical protein